MGTNAIMTAEKGFLLKLAFALESLHFYKLFRHCERSEAIPSLRSNLLQRDSGKACVAGRP